MTLVNDFSTNLLSRPTFMSFKCAKIDVDILNYSILFGAYNRKFLTENNHHISSLYIHVLLTFCDKIDENFPSGKFSGNFPHMKISGSFPSLCTALVDVYSRCLIPGWKTRARDSEPGIFF